MWEKCCTHQVAHEAQVCDGKEGGEDVEGHIVECCDVHHHEIHINGTHHQDDHTTADLPKPVREKKTNKRTVMVDQ